MKTKILVKMFCIPVFIMLSFGVLGPFFVSSNNWLYVLIGYFLMFLLSGVSIKFCYDIMVFILNKWGDL